jgi:NAD(P)-dependent dehydrogenase (short-subunit alcohol dehydrogenase family)|tara:strand:- start:997 stop:1791 length:795 start_codon:yes stop_codon:yes gene_type:complete
LSGIGPLKSLKGKTILIAGGAGYLGVPLCKLLVAEGANICIGETNQEQLDQTIQSICANSPDARVIGLPLDVGNETSIVNYVTASVNYFGKLHGLVNATSGASGKEIQDLTSDDFDLANNLNLTGPFLMAREAAKYMKGAGSIVMYSSMFGLVSPNQANYPHGLTRNPIEYGAGKAGMIQMVRYLASHFGPQNIRVNAVAPGPFPNVEKLNLPDEFIKNLERDTMLGRVGQNHETAGPVAFLLSDAASYITGHTLPIDGGWTAW